MAEPPKSASYEARIQNILGGLVGLPARYNPQRRSLAYETAAGLNEAGYTDNAMPQAITEAGSTTYRLVRGLDGRLYRQAFRQTNAAANAQGMLESSFTGKAQTEAKRGLDADRSRIERDFATRQAGITGQQMSDYQSGLGDLGQARGDYADWQGAQPVALPAEQQTPLVAPAPSIGAPQAGSGMNSNRQTAYGYDIPRIPQNPSVLWQGAAAPNLKTLEQRFGTGLQVKRRGGKLGFVVTRQG